MLHQQTTLVCKGKILDLATCKVMGILNITPDSFYAGSRIKGEDAILKKAGQMLEEGCSIIDVGGMSSRPGAAMISVEEELQRVIPAIAIILKHFPETIISIDTFRAAVAKAAVEAGASIVNDISAGNMDDQMFETVAALQVPYIMMHMQGTPATMQQNPQYENLITDILDFFVWKIEQLRTLGVLDIILDPGFGFGKTLQHNYQLLRFLHCLKLPGLPLLAGVSRKSMIYKLLDTSAEKALNGTTALHMLCLQEGVKILRVHDVKEAVECIRLWEYYQEIPADMTAI